ncbi:MAG: O-antigen ligase family protein [Acidobacteriota bacterium]
MSTSSQGALALPPSLSALPSARGEQSHRTAVLAFLGAHAALGAILFVFEALATAHALVALLVALGLALGRRSPAMASYAVVYLAGSELIWRMTGARVFWEFGKYSICLVTIVLILRFRLRSTLAPLAVVYLFLLAPAAAVTIGAYGFSDLTRQALSSSLSGPVTLALLVFYFSGIDSRWLRLERLLLAMMAPMVTALAFITLNVLTTARIQFNAHSNFATSGGYGPNQTSAVVGLAALLALLMAFHTRDRQLQLLYLVFTVGFLISTILTFSRGGVFNFVVCAVIWSVHYLQSARLRRALLVAGCLLLIAGAGLLPRINEWTQGSLSDRYSSLDTTGRSRLASADLHLFRTHLVLGVGAGRSAEERKKLIMRRIASHTEYTRLLAEHGIFGLAALLVMLAMVLLAYLRAPNAVTRGWVAGTAGWTFASMAHVSMRIALISLLFALATLRWPREGS